MASPPPFLPALHPSVPTHSEDICGHSHQTHRAQAWPLEKIGPANPFLSREENVGAKYGTGSKSWYRSGSGEGLLASTPHPANSCSCVVPAPQRQGDGSLCPPGRFRGFRSRNTEEGFSAVSFCPRSTEPSQAFQGLRCQLSEESI